LLANKVLRRILVTGFARLHGEDCAVGVLSTVVRALEQYHAIHAMRLPNPAATIAARSAYFLGKLVAEVMETHPLSLCHELERILSLVGTHLQLPRVPDDSTAKGIRLVILRTLKAAIREGALIQRPHRLQGLIIHSCVMIHSLSSTEMLDREERIENTQLRIENRE
jgi:hypothetical protein